MKHVPSTVVVGPDGLPRVTRGYTEIDGMRYFEDRIVVGRNGEYVLDRGVVEPSPQSTRQPMFSRF